MNRTTKTISSLAAAAAVSTAVLLGGATAASAATPTNSDAVQTRLSKSEAKATEPRAEELNKYKVGKKQLADIKKAQKLANTEKAKQIRQRESHGIYGINTGNGYYGAYQFDRGTWLANGGKQFGPTADKAPKWAQDYVMWKTHNARGWSPWGG